MDNLTHSLVGLAAAKAGIDRWSPAATTVCILAANAPDADILAVLGGRWFYLHHHRGITHSIVGAFALALLVPLLFFLGDRIIARIRREAPRVKWRGLLFASLIVTATHPLMDWTNNYGIRPFLPWSGRWFYGDLVFIVDPYLWLGLGGAAFLLSSKGKWRLAAWITLALVLTGLIFFGPLRRGGLAEPHTIRILWTVGLAVIIIARLTQLATRFGKGIAVVLLALVVVYWGVLAIAHEKALERARAAAGQLAVENNETIKRTAAMPTLANPLGWLCVTETDQATYRFNLSLWADDEREALRNVRRFEKPQGCEAEALAEAARDPRAEIFLDFARFPAARLEGDCLSRMLVQLADLRFTEPGERRGSFSLELPIEKGQK